MLYNQWEKIIKEFERSGIKHKVPLIIYPNLFLIVSLDDKCQEGERKS